MVFKANEDCEFNTLRVWIVLKQLYLRNTVIYGLNYQTLSNQTKISHTSLRKHIKVMIERGWAKWSNNHLIITGINKLKKHPNETCILVPVAEHKRDQILQLRKCILHRNIRNQETQIRTKQQIIQKARGNGKITKQEYNRIKSVGGIKNFEKLFNPVTTLSNNSIGKLFFIKRKGITYPLKQITGHRVQKGLRNKKLIKTTPRLELVKTNAVEFDYRLFNKQRLGGYIFNPVSKELFIRHSNRIELPMQ